MQDEAKREAADELWLKKEEGELTEEDVLDALLAAEVRGATKVRRALEEALPKQEYYVKCEDGPSDQSIGYLFARQQALAAADQSLADLTGE